MTRMTASEAISHLPDALARAERGDRIVLEDSGRDVAALVSLQDLALLRRFEDLDDLRAAEQALAESDERIPYDQVRKELGLAEAGADLPGHTD